MMTNLKKNGLATLLVFGLLGALQTKNSHGQSNRSTSSLLTDRTETSSFVGVDGSFSLLLAEDGGDHVATFRVDPVVNYLFNSQVGIHASIPLSHVRWDGGSKSIIGNTDVGLFYAAKLGPQLRLIARGAVMLPTADDDDFDALTAGSVSTLNRMTDVLSYFPSTSLRAGVSLMGDTSVLGYRVDFGLDRVLAQTDSSGFTIEERTYARFNGAIAFGPGRGIGLEMANFIDTDETVTQVGLTLSPSSKNRSLVIGLSSQLDYIIDNDNFGFFNVAAHIGFRPEI